ncbi:hypothetical protein [Pseudoclavibacter helvolus]|uniref:hypothetical protein n=1 Tax=Pseudoclavibacter helvolus TaxID=255205 RepID=UPI003C787A13
MTWSAIADAAGLPLSTVFTLQRVRKCTVETEAAVLGVRLNLFATKRIPAAGTKRRVEGLALLGWSKQAIADEAGVSRESLVAACTGRNQFVRPWLAHSVAKATGRLLTRTPTETRRVVSRSISDAKAKGYVPLMAWESLDDPTEKPKGVVAA